MKIVYYLPSLHIPGGLERITTFKANYFAENFENYNITIITSEQAGKLPHYPLSPKVQHIDLGVTFDFPFTQSRISKLIKYPFRYYLFKRRFSKLLIKIQPDITITTLRRELNFINKIKDGSIKIGEFHTSRRFYHSESLNGSNFLFKFIKKKWANSFLNNLSKLSKLVLLTHEGARDWPELNNITVIPNPITTPTNQHSDCTSHHVIAVGRYAYEKGFDLLIDAWEIVAKQHPEWKLHIYGGGGLRNELQDQINHLDLADTCILEDAVPNITDKYCKSSIFVLSSRFEGLPLVLGEAMACGVPPIAFSCPYGPRDMITNGVDGILVENGNIDLLAEKICYLIAHEEIRREIGKHARTSAKRFEMESISQQWKELFEQIIQKNIRTNI